MGLPHSACISSSAPTLALTQLAMQWPLNNCSQPLVFHSEHGLTRDSEEHHLERLLATEAQVLDSPGPFHLYQPERVNLSFSDLSLRAS
jgi:hypothetical protein